jgi:NH3-dependent NAD+ synthetase
MDEPEIAQRLVAALTEGVRRRLLSDVPIGFYLSGGVDSSLSTALAATVSPGRIKTFTLTYDSDSTTPGKEEDQRWARTVAEQYGTEHHEERLPRVAEEFPRSSGTSISRSPASSRPYPLSPHQSTRPGCPLPAMAPTSCSAATSPTVSPR